MRPLLDGGVILITGASSGIGAELARQLAPRAAAVALVARRTERLEALAAELRGRVPFLPVTVHACDLTDLDAAAAMLAAVQAAHGPIDVLINNAGMGDIGLYEDARWEKTQQMITLNITALSYLTRAVLPSMVARRQGSILNVSSGFGLAWMPTFAAYVGTKHYVSAFTEALSAELHGTGVFAGHLCPGPVATEFEQVAENPFGQEVPGFLEQSAEDCVRRALAGFRRGRVRVVPSLLIGLALALGGLTPVALLRAAYGPTAAAARRRLHG